MITIFTPAYNRAYILGVLYQSLCRQTSQGFEWLIIDDGSTDGTKALAEKWIQENKIKIRYYWQENAGKSNSHNRGAELTDTELFVCVDSDDYLRDDAIEIILEHWNHDRAENLVGMLAFRGTKEGKPITIYQDKGTATDTLKHFYDTKIITGDTMLVYRVDVLKKHKFPEFSNEKFVPESYLYDLLDQEGKLLLLPEILYICEYLEDGYTRNMTKLIADNPQGYLAWIEQRLKLEHTIKGRVADTIRYIAIAVKARKKKKIVHSVYPAYSVLLYPAGYLFYYRRYRKYEE